MKGRKIAKPASLGCNPWSTCIFQPSQPVFDEIRFNTNPDLAPDEKDDDSVIRQERRKNTRFSDDKEINTRLINMKRRAEGKGMLFDLDEDWLMAKFATEFCEVTGIKFSGNSLRDPFTRTIDRTDNNAGYTKDNCKVVVWIYNQAKKDHGAEHVLEMALALVRRHRGA